MKQYIFDTHTELKECSYLSAASIIKCNKDTCNFMTLHINNYDLNRF